MNRKIGEEVALFLSKIHLQVSVEKNNNYFVVGDEICIKLPEYAEKEDLDFNLNYIIEGIVNYDVDEVLFRSQWLSISKVTVLARRIKGKPDVRLEKRRHLIKGRLFPAYIFEKINRSNDEHEG